MFLLKVKGKSKNEIEIFFISQALIDYIDKWNQCLIVYHVSIYVFILLTFLENYHVLLIQKY